MNDKIGKLIGLTILVLLIFVAIWAETATRYYAVYEGVPYEHRLYKSSARSDKKALEKLVRKIEADGYNPEDFNYRKR